MVKRKRIWNYGDNDDEFYENFGIRNGDVCENGGGGGEGDGGEDGDPVEGCGLEPETDECDKEIPDNNGGVNTGDPVDINNCPTFEPPSSSDSESDNGSDGGSGPDTDLDNNVNNPPCSSPSSEGESCEEGDYSCINSTDSPGSAIPDGECDENEIEGTCGPDPMSSDSEDEPEEIPIPGVIPVPVGNCEPCEEGYRTLCVPKNDEDFARLTKGMDVKEPEGGWCEPNDTDCPDGNYLVCVKDEKHPDGDWDGDDIINHLDSDDDDDNIPDDVDDEPFSDLPVAGVGGGDVIVQDPPLLDPVEGEPEGELDWKCAQDAPGTSSIAQGGGRSACDGVWQEVNRLRVTRGLRPLLWDDRLASSAQKQAEYLHELGETENLTHKGEDGKGQIQRAQAAGYDSTWVMENAHFVPEGSPRDVVLGSENARGWWQDHDPENPFDHGPNMVREDTQRAGVGCYCGYIVFEAARTPRGEDDSDRSNDPEVEPYPDRSMANTPEENEREQQGQGGTDYVCRDENGNVMDCSQIERFGPVCINSVTNLAVTCPPWLEEEEDKPQTQQPEDPDPVFDPSEWDYFSPNWDTFSQNLNSDGRYRGVSQYERDRFWHWINTFWEEDVNSEAKYDALSPSERVSFWYRVNNLAMTRYIHPSRRFTPSQEALNDPDKMLFEMINKFRQVNGLPLWEWNDKIYNQAKFIAQQQHEAGMMTHMFDNLAYPGERYDGPTLTNVSGGEGEGVLTPCMAFKGWANSTGHRAWLLGNNIQAATALHGGYGAATWSGEDIWDVSVPFEYWEPEMC